MKKILVIALLLGLLCVPAFAQSRLGASIVYNATFEKGAGLCAGSVGAFVSGGYYFGSGLGVEGKVGYLYPLTGSHTMQGLYADAQAVYTYGVNSWLDAAAGAGLCMDLHFFEGRPLFNLGLAAKAEAVFKTGPSFNLVQEFGYRLTFLQLRGKVAALDCSNSFTAALDMQGAF